MATVGVGHGGQAAAQGGGIELRGVSAALLQELSIHISLRFTNLCLPFAASRSLPHLPFALLAPRGGGLL